MRFPSTVLVVAVASCAGEAPPVESSPTFAKEIQDAQVRMHRRFASAQQIEGAIAHGDLDRAHREAAALSSLEEPAVSPQWRPYLDRVAVWAHQVEIAPDVIAAAKASAMLGRQCAKCHEDISVKVAFPDAIRPAEDTRLAPQMLGHQWAAARMWEGLIGPSERRWIDGAQALTEVPLAIVAEEPMTVARMDATQPEGNRIGDDVARVRLYARRALVARDQDERAEIFGTMLANCAHCHAAIRDR